MSANTRMIIGVIATIVIAMSVGMIAAYLAGAYPVSGWGLDGYWIVPPVAQAVSVAATLVSVVVSLSLTVRWAERA